MAMPIQRVLKGILHIKQHQVTLLRRLMSRGERRINLLAALIERLFAGLHPGEDALGSIVEGLLDLRVGRATPDARNAVTGPLVEQL